MWKFVLIIIFFPCASYALWPLSWEFGNEKRFLGPLVSYEKENDNTRLTIRPFLFSYDSENGGVYDYLYPLGRVAKERSYFFPFYLSKQYTDEKDSSFLFFFHGTSAKGDYFGFFPFYGKLYDRFGHDEMGFCMWPLYSYTESEGAIKTNILWPFFSVYSGTDEGFKAWPLFGMREKKGVKSSKFFLWPFFFKEEKNLDTDEPVDVFYAIPFYLSSKSRTRDESIIMWPIYGHLKDQYKESWNILWPIFSRTKGEEEDSYGFFPLIFSEQKGTNSRLSLLWPLLYDQREWYMREEKYVKIRVLLLNRYVNDEDGTFLSVWPFFEHQNKKETSTTLSPSILPVRLTGFDRIIKPLYTLYEHKQEKGKSMVSLLYGLYTREREGENWKTRFAFLFEMEKKGDRLGFEFLSGLFGVSKDYVKILFVPIKKE